MKIILRQDVKGLGKEGELKDVKDGYARNFLLPKELVYSATEDNIRLLEAENRRKKRKEERELEDKKALAEKIRKISCTISTRVGEKETLFGSVTKEDIITALFQEQKIKLEKQSVLLSEPIKKLGVYKVPLRLASGIESELKVWVVKER